MSSQTITKKDIFIKVIKKNLKVFGFIVAFCFAIAMFMIFTDVLAEEESLSLILGIFIGFPLLGIGGIVVMGMGSLKLIRRQERQFGFNFDDEMRRAGIINLNKATEEWFFIAGIGAIYPIRKGYISRFSARRMSTRGGAFLELKTHSIDGKKFKMSLPEAYNLTHLEQWLKLKNEYSKGKKKSRIPATLLMVAVGIVAIGYGIWQMSELHELRRDGVRATAEITNLRRSGRYSTGTTTLLFRASGELRHIIAEISPARTWEIGDRIEIYYLPRDASVLRTENGMNRAPAFEIVAIIAGVAIIGYAIVHLQSQTPKGIQNKEDRIASRRHIRVLKPKIGVKAYVLTILIGGLSLALWGFISNIHNESFLWYWQILAAIGIIVIIYILYANLCDAFNERVTLHDDYFIFRDISGNLHKIGYGKNCQNGEYVNQKNGGPAVRIIIIPETEEDEEFDVEYDLKGLQDIINLELEVKEYRTRTWHNVPTLDLSTDEFKIPELKSYSLKWAVTTMFLTLGLIAAIWTFEHIIERPEVETPEVAYQTSEEEYLLTNEGTFDDFLSQVNEMSPEEFMEWLANNQNVIDADVFGELENLLNLTVIEPGFRITHSHAILTQHCFELEDLLQEIAEIGEESRVAENIHMLEELLSDALETELFAETTYSFIEGGFEHAVVYFINSYDETDENFVRLKLDIYFEFGTHDCVE